MKHFLILLFLLPACASAQINWNQVFGKQRFQQGLGLPSTDTANFRTSVDTSAIVLNRADSSVYFRYKGKWRTLASGGSGSTPNLQQVMEVGSQVRTTIAIPNKFISIIDTFNRSSTYIRMSCGSSSAGLDIYGNGFQSSFVNGSQIGLNLLQNSGSAKAGGILLGYNGQVSDSFAMVLNYFKSSTGAQRNLLPKFTNNTPELITKSYLPESNGTLTNKILLNGSTFTTDDNGQINLGTIGGTGTVTSISQGYGLSASPNPIIATGTISVDTATLSGKYLRVTDTALLSNRIDNKMGGIDVLKLIGFNIKAESFGLTLPDVSTQLATSSQQLALYPFYWNKSDSIRGVAWFNRATTVITPNANYNGVAIYSISGTNLTRETFTTNSGTFWDAAANIWKAQPITPKFLEKGIYFIGYQVSGTGTLPTIAAGEPLVVGAGTAFATPPTEVNPNGVRFSSFIANAATTPPSSIAIGGTTGRVGIPYFLFY